MSFRTSGQIPRRQMVITSLDYLRRVKLFHRPLWRTPGAICISRHPSKPLRRPVIPPLLRLPAARKAYVPVVDANLAIRHGEVLIRSSPSADTNRSLDNVLLILVRSENGQARMCSRVALRRRITSRPYWHNPVMFTARIE